MRIPFMVCIVSLLLSIVIDLSLYIFIKKNCKKKTAQRIYLYSSIALWIFLVIVYLIPRQSDNSILPLMWMLFSYLTVYLAKTVCLVFCIISYLPRLWKGKTWSLGKYVGLPLGLLTLTTMWYGVFFTRKDIQINKVEISSPKIPENFKNKRILQISDLHVGTWGNDTSFVSKLVNSINDQKADIVFFTGDIVNRTSDELKPFVTVLSRIKAPMGVYSIMGNHDYGDYIRWDNPSEKTNNIASLKAMQKSMGWEMLDNSHTVLKENNDSIILIGVGNWGKPPFHQYGDLKKAYDNLKDENFKILLSHDPDHWQMRVLPLSNIDLTLSGHTHAMQFQIGNWSPAKYKYQNWGGLYSNSDGKDDQYLYVNIGSGEVGMPMRIGNAKPEITVITLK